MIRCESLFEIFRKNGMDFFTGVPDSTFKDFMSFLADNHGKTLTNRVAAIERDAIGLASGYHLATGKIPIVYMQNSGLGNTVNPITSLADSEVYGIPLVLLIGWRGEPGKHDEPQHKKMGRITIPLLETLEIPYRILPADSEGAEEVIRDSIKQASENHKPVALVIKSDILEKYSPEKKAIKQYSLSREEAIKIAAHSLNSLEIIVSTTGKASRELFEYREHQGIGHQKDFLMVGSMGLALSTGAEIAFQKPERKVFIFDGDGAALMSLGSLATVGNYKPSNLYHIIFDNSSYESTGGQPTFSENIDFEKIALACGYRKSVTAKTKEELEGFLKEMKSAEGPYLLVVKVNSSSRKDLGRPTTTPLENKKAFMEFLKK